jgi:hypothetical protein
MLPKELNVQVDRSLPADTIVVSSYAVLDLIELGRAPAVSGPTVAKPEPEPKRAPVRKLRKKHHKNKRGRGPHGYRRTPRVRHTSPSVEQALTAYQKNPVKLNDVETYVFTRYYGVNGHRRSSLGVIGDRVGYTLGSMSVVLAHAHKALGLPHAEGSVKRGYNASAMRKAMRIVAGSDNHGTVVAGKDDPTAVRHAVKQNMEGRR